MMQKIIHAIVVTLALTLALTGLSVAQDQLGDIKFPASAKSQEAQAHFVRGVKYLHSFAFEYAVGAFQEASRIEPGFAMAYWGESMSHNHPLLSERDPESPRAALQKLGSTREARLSKAPTDREKGFLEAAELLWGEGSEKERGLAYTGRMARLAAQYPHDDEVQAFYAVALLASVRHRDGDPDFRIRMKAGAIAQNIFSKNPNHPGAAHYVIHAFDDPVHAPLALTAADRYARIAPASSHALHMPSHIFIQHGMWERVVASNIDSYNAAYEEWKKRDTIGETRAYFAAVYVWHALDWGQYGSLQMGDYARALKDIELMKPVAEETDAAQAANGPSEMTARYIVETEQWQVRPITDKTTPTEVFAIGMSAIRTGDMAAAEKADAKLTALYKKEQPTGHDHGLAGRRGNKPLVIMHKEMSALAHLAKGRKEEAITLMQEAVEIQESMGLPNGAAVPIKPAHELYGEALLEIGQPEEAMAQFDKQLDRTPNRPRSLLGRARAAAKVGDTRTARASYEQVMNIWKSGGDRYAMDEARRYVKMQGDE